MYCNVPGVLFKWKFISVPKSQHTTVKYTQSFSKHTSGIYTLRCPTQDSFYRTSSGNLPIRTHILTVRKSPNTGAHPATTFFGHKLSFLQSRSFQTHMLLSQFPNTNSVFQPTGVHSKYARKSTLGDFQARTHYKSTEVHRQQSCYYGTQLQLVYIVA
jgi:hypothetical protein